MPLSVLYHQNLPNKIKEINMKTKFELHSLEFYCLVCLFIKKKINNIKY